MKLFNKYRPDKVITSSAGFSPNNEAISVLFDNLTLDLQGNRPDLSDVTTFTFHIETEVTDDRPDISIDIRYFIKKSANATAKLVFIGAETLHSEDFLFGAECDGNDMMHIKCPGRSSAKGAPFTITLALFAHRVNANEVVMMAIDAADISRA